MCTSSGWKKTTLMKLALNVLGILNESTDSVQSRCYNMSGCSRLAQFFCFLLITNPILPVLSSELGRQSICSSWLLFNHFAFCCMGWRWVKCFYHSTDSQGILGHLTAIKITAGVLIHHPRHHHVAWQYANVATPCPRCHLSLLSSLSSSPGKAAGSPPSVIYTLVPICAAGWKWCWGWCWN